MAAKDLKINVLFQDTGIIYNEMKKVTEMEDGVDIEVLRQNILDCISKNSKVDADNNIITIKY